ncbi:MULTISPECIES: hypothetical protein [unclassified Leucobacter]|uniref:hypothetical protein n=1 Tax=unclassified Leucobacter TaxID=2621730 RepID=UPI003015BE7F
MITHDMIGTDEDLAREVLIVARGIAPCISSFAAGSEEQKDALAILRRVYTDIQKRGPRFVKSQRIGPASVDYGSISSAFDGDPSRALRALCSNMNGRGLSVGSFPKERPVSRLWPESYR